MTTTATRPRPQGHPGYSVTKDRAPETAAEARRLVRVAITAWGLEDAADTAALLLSELVSNAVRHARGPAIRVIVDRPTAGRVRLAVVDRSPARLPVPRSPGEGDPSGRGLLLVESCAARWGYDLLGPGLRPWGKRVWAELEVPP